MQKDNNLCFSIHKACYDKPGLINVTEENLTYIYLATSYGHLLQERDVVTHQVSLLIDRSIGSFIN